MNKIATILFAALLVPSVSFGSGDNAAKIHLVKKIYQEASHDDEPGVKILNRYADASLKKAIRTASRSADLCVEADPIWNSQDPETEVKINVSALPNGKIRASFKQWGSPVKVDYSVNCFGNVCKVTDVDHLKRTWLQCR